MNQLVAGMSELLQRTIGEAIRIETVLTAGLWNTYADAAQIENAILNLAVNARDAMPEGGRLTIETCNACWTMPTPTYERRRRVRTIRHDRRHRHRHRDGGRRRR